MTKSLACTREARKRKWPDAGAHCEGTCGSHLLMSTIFVHCGQAGNEIGGVVWRLAWAEKPPRRWFFDERGTARAVFVDTEPKVVRGVVRSLGPERVHPRCALVEQSGRGNNWAMGYGGVDGGGRNGIADAALEALRWQWERCDWCTGVVLSHSIGGGTGSGLGSLLLQELRDEHPRHYLTAAAMCPFAAGELPLGHYNATLALSFLQEFADAIILFDNTQLLRHLTSSAAVQSHAASHSSQQPARLDMKHLDAYVGSGLAGLTFPTDGPLGRRPFDAADLVTSVCPMPSLKCLTLQTAPAPMIPAAAGSGGASGGSGGSGVGGVGAVASISRLGSGAGRPAPWETLVGDLVSRTSRYDLLDRPVLSLASQVIGRGVAGEPPDERIKHRLLQLLGGSPCSPFPVDYKLSASPATALPSQNALRSLTLVSNRSSAGPQLEQILIRAKLQLLGKAYVHHFERHGVSTEFIAERAEYMQTIVDEYEGCRAAFAGSQPPVVSPVRAAGAAASLSPRGTLSSPGNPAAPVTPSNV